jgi:hypothetical protein
MLNTYSFLQVKYYYVRDPETAKALKITEPGCIYLIKPTQTVFENSEPNLKICEFPFVTKLFLTREQMTNGTESNSFKEINSLVLEKPIVVKNYA